MRWIPRDQSPYEWVAVAIMVPVAVVVLALVLGLAGLIPMVLATICLGAGLVRARKPFAAWLEARSQSSSRRTTR